MRIIALIMFAWLACTMPCAPASAEPIDVSTISCSMVAQAMDKKGEKDIAFVNSILNWMGGYHATEKQGTVVDWKKLSDAFDATVAYCVSHSDVGVLSASEKFMGKHIEEAGTNAFDLAIITCEVLLSGKSPLKDPGHTFMWLAGYHASYDKGSTMLDIDLFIENVGKIAKYCEAHPKVGLVTVSEKFMAGDE